MWAPKLRLKYFIIVIFACALGPTHTLAEVAVSFELDSIEATPNGHFTARILLTGTSSLAVAPPKFSASDSFSGQVAFRDVATAPLSGRSVDQVIFSLKFTPLRILPHGQYTLPSSDLQLGSEKKTVTWPTVQIVSELARTSTNLRLWHEVSDRTPFFGEQVVYRVHALIPTEASHVELNNAEISGVWSEDFPLEVGKDVGGERKSLKKERALFALKPGEVRIPARSVYFELQGARPIRRRFRSDAEQLGSSGTGLDALNPRQLLDSLEAQSTTQSTTRLSAVRLSTDGLSLNVKPLPDRPLEGQQYVPVGEFSMRLDIEHSSSGKEGVRSAAVTVSGDGNLRPIRSLAYEDNDSFTVFVSPEDTTSEVREGKLRYARKFSLTLVPKRSGMLQVPEFRLLTFDPRTESYQTLRTSKEAVFGSRETAAKVGPTHSALHGLELLGVTRTGDLILIPVPQVSRGTIVLLLLLPPVILGLGGLVAGRTEQLKTTQRRRRALPNARDAVQNSIRVTYDDIVRIFVHFVLETIGEEMRALTPQEACGLLERAFPGKADVIATLKELFQQLERDRFGGDSKELASDVADRVLSLLEQLPG